MGGKTVVLNSARMNYDGKLDMSVLSSDVTEYAVTEQDQILERVQGMEPGDPRIYPQTGRIQSGLGVRRLFQKKSDKRYSLFRIEAEQGLFLTAVFTAECNT